MALKKRVFEIVGFGERKDESNWVERLEFKTELTQFHFISSSLPLKSHSVFALSLFFFSILFVFSLKNKLYIFFDGSC
jgi:hypothetical protein